MRQSKQAYEAFGSRLVEVINDNPYLLTTLDGITWARADDIAAMEWNGKKKVDHDDPKRYVAAVREVLRQAYNDGHMALPYDEAVARAEALAEPTLDGFLAKIKDRMPHPDEGLTKHGDWLYLSRHYRTERESANELMRMIVKTPAPLDAWENIEPRLDLYVPRGCRSVQTQPAARPASPGSTRCSLRQLSPADNARRELQLRLQ